MAVDTHRIANREATPAGRLVAAAGAGDEGAWADLVESFGPLVYGIARSFRLDAADAADVSQTVWLRLVEHLDRLRDPERVGAWLAATTRNECLRTLRLSKRELPVDDEAVFEGDGREEPLEAQLVLSERDSALWDAFNALPGRCRQLLRAAVADPKPSYDEIAAAAGIAVGSVGPTKARCLTCLRNTVERRCIDLGAAAS